MATSPLAENTIIELGKKIVANLKKSGETDLLTNWMAHHIAELIQEADAAVGTSNALAKKNACMDAILKLWAYRATLVHGSRPFESAELAAQTLAKLDPNSAPNFYFQVLKKSVKKSSDEDGYQELQWLQFAEAVDEAARSLIGFCIGLAIKDHQGEFNEWIQLSKAVTQDGESFDIELVEALASIELLPVNDVEIRAQAEKAERIQKQLEMISKALDALKIEPSPT